MKNFNRLLSFINSKFPFELQEEWDRSGVWYYPEKDIKNLAISLEIEDFNKEEILSADAFLVHHPPFLSDESDLSKKQLAVLELIKKEKKGLIVCHTNADVAPNSFADYILRKAGISEAEPIIRTMLKRFKLVTYLPEDSAKELLKLIKDNNLGKIGLYEACAFLAQGFGHFCASNFTKPYTGKTGECNFVKELRLEFEVSKNDLEKALELIESFHPYEEPVIEVYKFKRFIKGNGYGRMFKCDWSVDDLISVLSDLEIEIVDLSVEHDKAGLVAFLPGSGRKLIKYVLKYRFDTFITSDLGYHEKKFLKQEGINIIEISHDSVESWFVDWVSDELGKYLSDLNITLKRRRYGKYKHS